MSKHSIDVKFGEHTLTLETGEIARQADGAIFATMGGTQVLVTVVFKKEGGEANSFFPLTVDYQEKFYAAGRVPGGFKKREGSPSEDEILVSRLIDRPIRPLFPDAFRNEVQVIATLMSLDPEVSPDVVAMIASSAALAISGIPFQGPIGAARVGYKDGMYLLNPSNKALASSELNLMVAGTSDAILMVESEAKELSEEVMLGAVLFGHEMMKPVINAINELKKKAGKPAFNFVPPAKNTELEQKINELALTGIAAAYAKKDKQERYEALDALKKTMMTTLSAQDENFDASYAVEYFFTLQSQHVRQQILAGEARIDGRDTKTVRPIAIRTEVLDRSHGSALFTRGETQALVVATLGNERDSQLLDAVAGESKDRFMLHYNFPPFSVGEVGRVGSPKRREVGHGRLAKRAMMAVLPTQAEFPYVLRIVSEITESNGSSSMATVCGSSLALMDAGVPIKAPVAGVAMGLIKEGDKFAVLTDILGDEDHLGDMDFKVAGTTKGVTALQMDIKITGITKEIMEQALLQAHEGRQHILGVMAKTISTAKTELSVHAPRIITMKIAEDKVRTIIGKGGATIKGLTESTGVSIDIDDSGTLQLFSPDASALEEAQRQIKLLVAELEVGKDYEGKVIRIVEFGAFINLLPGKDGLLHISQICADRNQKVEAVLQEGQSVRVHVAGIDKQGRVKLEWLDKPHKVEAAPAEVSSEVETEAEVKTEE